jgi:hypothetical protein
VIYIFIYSNNPIPSHSSTIHVIDNNQHYITDAPVVQNSNAPLYIKPIISKKKITQQDLVITKHDNAIWNLTITNNEPKRPQPTENRHNV